VTRANLIQPLPFCAACAIRNAKFKQVTRAEVSELWPALGCIKSCVTELGPNSDHKCEA
jgi:hypothetical protein